jgi:hypothetical protein
MKNTPGVIQRFFDAVKREEIASLRGFMTAYLGGKVSDNPFTQKAPDYRISSAERADLKDTWDRAFWQAQHFIMDASTAMAVLDYVGGDPMESLNIISVFEGGGLLPTAFVIKFEHYADLASFAFATVA